MKKGTTASTRKEQTGRISGIDYGAQIQSLIEQYGIIDQEMASLAIRGKIERGRDRVVEYHLQRWVREKRLVRSAKKYYGRTLYYLKSQSPSLLGHNYRMAKVAQHLIMHTPSGKYVSLSATVVDGVRPDAVLRFSGKTSTLIYLEYQTTTESWTTPKKVNQYRAAQVDGLIMFFVERDDVFQLEMAQTATAGEFCFANPAAVLASYTPWEDNLYFFGGSTGERLPLIKPSK